MLKSRAQVSRARIANAKYRINKLRSQIKQRLAADSPAIIHSHDPIAGYASLAFSKQHPLLYTAHSPLSREILMDLGDEELSRYVRELEMLVYQGHNAILAVDSGQAEIINKDFGIDHNKILVIPNAVDYQDIRRQSAETAPQFLSQVKTINPGGLNLLLPRRLVEKNGPLVAIEAMSLLPIDFHLWITGDGPMHSKVKRAIEKYGLHGRVHLLGTQPRNRVLGLMGAMDIVLIPSVPSHGVVEASSVAALEAMALGKPVVASAIGGLLEIITHNQTGLLFPAAEPRALAESVLQLKSYEMRRSLGEEASRYIEQVWSVDKWAGQISKTYRALLERYR